MAIISGGRLNIWNAVKKQFEVVHPETEVARITDFADGIVQKLALTSAMAAITELQKDSWFGKLLKMALTASGVKYSIAQNGYVCLGSLFGGLIIQWGSSDSVSIVNNNKILTQPYPISITKALKVFTTLYDVTASKDYNGGVIASIIEYDAQSVTMVLDVISITNTRKGQIFFLVIGS